MAQNITTEHLAADGDVALIVGTPPDIKLIVSCATLTATSPVFRAMLGPHFQEGQVERSGEHPQEIVLPEDDAEGVADMCRLLHHRVDGFKAKALNYERLLNLVVAIDKYQCLHILQIQIRWITQRYFATYANPDWTQAVQDVAITYVAHDPENFKLATSRLIKDFEDQISDVSEHPAVRHIPLNALLAMAEIRQKAQQKISLDLPRLGMSDCEFCYNFNFEFVKQLCLMFKDDVWPPNFEGSSIKDTLSLVKVEEAIEID